MNRSLSGPAGLTRRGLQISLGLFFCAVAVPTALLIYRAYTQSRWETFHRQQVAAQELAVSIDRRASELLRIEEARAFTDYGFLVVTGDPALNFLQRSALSTYPVQAELPGVMGYFQVDAHGRFSTPLLPADSTQATQYGVSTVELRGRQDLQNRLLDILSRNHLVSSRTPETIADASAEQRGQSTVSEAEPPARRDRSASQAAAPASRASPQAAFDRLKTQRAETTVLEKAGSAIEADRAPLNVAPEQERAENFFDKKAVSQDGRVSRKEQSAVPEALGGAATGAMGKADELSTPRIPARVSTFESEIDPFDLSRLSSGHWVLFRKVWHAQQRYTQGLLIDQNTFLRGVFAANYSGTALAATTDLSIAYGNDIIPLVTTASGYGDAYSSRSLQGTLLYQTRLSAPLNEVELVFHIKRLPGNDPNVTLIAWLAGVLGMVLAGGTYWLYRLGLRQIDLSNQQHDFIAAVSHELKTPLTSIRMYGEMLREGWVQEDKRKSYYDFIFSESERLSRLINNVLQLARVTRNEQAPDCKPLRAVDLASGMLSKISSQVSHAGFQLRWDYDHVPDTAMVSVDADSVAQILINLVDNAIKFSAHSTRKNIDIVWRCTTSSLSVSVRDYGPGLPTDKLKKIFKLFYRLENELTRETVGTGIGLALVQQLVNGMQGTIEVSNRDPGAEFILNFPTLTERSSL